MSTTKSADTSDLLLALRDSTSEADWSRLGQLLSAARAALLPRASAGDVALATGLSDRTIWSVESGKAQPLRTTVRLLVQYYCARGVIFRADNGELSVQPPASIFEADA